MTVSRVPNVEGGIQPTIVTAKGDLITAVANANPARLGVGSDGQLLTADSTTATGLSYQSNFAAGKNKIINGDFYVNQRNFSSTTTDTTFGFDRWQLRCSGGTVTMSAQTFTAGTAPVAGYEGKNYLRMVTSGQSGTSNFAYFLQRIEDVRTFAGQTVTVSFWAKASTGTPKIGVSVEQVMGTGGTGGSTTAVGDITISSSWVRYTKTIAIPSLSGGTVGTGSNLIWEIWTSAGTSFSPAYTGIGIQNVTIDMWGFQVEAGSTATAFQTATGTIQGELAACQRYFQNTEFVSLCHARATTSIEGSIMFPVTMRTAPTLTAGTAWQFYDAFGNGFTQSSANGTLAVSGANTKGAFVSLGNFTGLTQGRTYAANAAGQGSFTLSAEL